MFFNLRGRHFWERYGSLKQGRDRQYSLLTEKSFTNVADLCLFVFLSRALSITWQVFIYGPCGMTEGVYVIAPGDLLKYENGVFHEKNS